VSALKPVTGKNRYCGPTVIATITGVTTDQAAALGRAVLGRRAIRGMRTAELMGALDRLGCGTMLEEVFASRRDRPTLQRWMAERPESMRKVPLVVLVTNHWVAVHGDLVVCAKQRREKRLIASAAARLSKVVRVWAVTLPQGPIKLPDELKRKPPAIDPGQRQKAKRIADKLGLSVERNTAWKTIDITIDDWLVLGAKLGAEDEDALADWLSEEGSVHYSWGEAAGALESMAKLAGVAI
jgi:hypothetical protein